MRGVSENKKRSLLKVRKEPPQRIDSWNNGTKPREGQVSQPAGSRLGFPTWKVGAIYLAVRPLFRLFARAACVAAQTSVSCLERPAIFTAKDPTHAALSLFCLAIHSWDKPWYQVVHQWSFLRRPASVMRGRQQADPPHQQPDETAAPTSLQFSVISLFICYTEDLRGEGVRESGYGRVRSAKKFV